MGTNWWLFTRVALVCLAGAQAHGAASPIIRDGTIGAAAGALTGVNNHYTIRHEDGRINGDNLFHSFSTFNVPNGGSATFTGLPNIANVLTRVTGGSRSTIEGTLRTSGMTPNFYLINPAGVIFGPGAQLEVGGSFIVTTADRVTFADGYRLNARGPVDNLLTSAAPSAFGFLSQRPASIVLNATTGTQGVRLKVEPEKFLSLVGGDIKITKGELSAPSGRINIVSVNSAGTFELPGADFDAALDTRHFSRLGNISFSKNAQLDTRGSMGSQGGTIFVAGENLAVRDSKIYTLNARPGIGFDFSIRNEMSLTRSIISSDSSSDGSAGNIEITARRLQILSNSQIISQPQDWAAAGGGNISLNADSILLSDSTISAQSGGQSNAGVAGNISIQAGTLDLIRGTISAKAPVNDGGNISVAVDGLMRVSGSEITAQSGRDGASITLSPFVLILEEQSLINGLAEGRPVRVEIAPSTIFWKSDDSRILSRSVSLPPDLDLAATVLALSAEPLGADARLPERCGVRLTGGTSSFTITGPALPATPVEWQPEYSFKDLER